MRSNKVEEKYGKLTVIGEAELKVFSSGATKKQVLTKCDCGTEKVVNLAHLKRGAIQSCGCLKKELCRDNRIGNKLGHSTKLQIKAGDIFGYREVIGIGKEVKYNCGSKNYFWKTKCICGNEGEYAGSRLNKGLTTSCGCMTKKEADGMSNSRIYRIWVGMKQRCNNAKDPAYGRYGGRGIQVERKDFMSFYNDMGETYKTHCITYGEGNTQIDRINNNGNYIRSNCKRSTRIEQNNNKSTNVVYEGKTLSERGRLLNIDTSLINRRVKKLGRDIKKAIFTPVKH